MKAQYSWLVQLFGVIILFCKSKYLQLYCQKKKNSFKKINSFFYFKSTVQVLHMLRERLLPRRQNEINKHKAQWLSCKTNVCK